MPKGKEFWSRDFANRYGHSSLVADKDKYLCASEAPRYRFNVIGAGTMGQEHIRVTNFEVPQVRLSDHLPLICDFEVEQADAAAKAADDAEDVVDVDFEEVDENDKK